METTVRLISLKEFSTLKINGGLQSGTQVAEDDRSLLESFPTVTATRFGENWTSLDAQNWCWVQEPPVLVLLWLPTAIQARGWS